MQHRLYVDTYTPLHF